MAIVPNCPPSQPMQLTAGDFHGIIGRSEPMRRLYPLIEKAARAGLLPIIVRGATGTGKEQVARLSHDLSPRREGPYVPFNCTTVSVEMMESVLFGHVKGAFTGAHQDTPGLLRQAHGGTLFVDELGAMPMAMQVKLLRAVEYGEVRSVGSATVDYVDVRIVAATNRKLEAMVEGGTFLPDLYHRLNGLQIVLPSLAERRDDIPLLARHFLTVLAKGGDALELAEEAMGCLAQQDFPGQVRQLRMMVGRLHALHEGPGAISLAEVQAELARGEAKAKPPLDHHADPRWLDLEGRTLANAEGEVGRRAMVRCGGNKSAAAKLLGIHRNRLSMILKRAG